MDCNVLVTRMISKPAIEFLEARCKTLEINPHDRPMTREELMSAVRGRDGVLCLLTDAIDETILREATGCRVFANHAVGFNNVEVDAATRLGIMVTNTPGVLTETTADLTWALILAVARRVVESDQFMRAGKYTAWGPLLLLGTDVYGKTLGIVGAGRIGEAVARRAVGFGMTILYADVRANDIMESQHNARRVGLDELSKTSDFVTLHVPLLPETTHLIGPHELDLMKPAAYLINTCRGPVVDEKALVRALETQSIAGAGLDVYENEPAVESALLPMQNVVLLPHVGSASIETRTKMAMMAAENLVAGLEGKRPPNLVNPDVLNRPH